MGGGVYHLSLVLMLDVLFTLPQEMRQKTDVEVECK